MKRLAVLAILLSSSTLFSQSLSTFIAPDSQSVCFRIDEKVDALTCVPMSVMRSTFAGYQVGDPSPVHALRQNAIDQNAQIAELMRQSRECLGQLGPLQAQQHSEMLKQQRDALTKDLDASAPKDTHWDAASKKYVANDKPKDKAIK